MYHHQQQGSSSYDYPSYPTTPFETTAPPAQASGRTVRSNTSQTHSPSQPASFQASSSYPSSGAYASAPTPYGISSAQTQQWQQESWASQQYAQPFTSQPMQAEMTYTSSSTTAAPRGDDAATISTPDTRTSGFAPSNMPPAQEPRRQESGYSQPPLPTSSHPSSPPRNRRREKESPMMASATATASGLDFVKMQESYRFIMDSTSSVSSGISSSRTPSAETLERMLQSANHGVQMLQSAAIAQSNPDMRPTTGVGDKDAPAPKRQKSDEHAQEGQTCLGCNATSTPEWRRGPLGPRTLCNACGLVYAKLLKKRARGEARVRAGDNAGQSSQQPIDESNALSSGGSEDEDSYGSQDRRSEFGDHGRRG